VSGCNLIVKMLIARDHREINDGLGLAGLCIAGTVCIALDRAFAFTGYNIQTYDGNR